MELKRISAEALPKALELAEHYRLLNEPEQAESICKDVLEIEPNNQLAIRLMVLAISDQFGLRQSANVQHAQEVANQLEDEYERCYYTGVMMERFARAKLHGHAHLNMVRDWIYQAMDKFEQAQQMRPTGNDAALLRWNTCVRLLERLPKTGEAVVTPDYGD
jgi:hypothetical protein